MEVVIVIVSAGRAEKPMRALGLFGRRALVCVPEGETAAYRRLGEQVQVMGHPPKRAGALCNWILDAVAGPVVLVNDTVSRAGSLTAEGPTYYRRPQEVAQILETAAITAEGMGARMFGFGIGAVMDSFAPQDPFRLVGALSGVVGIIGRDFRYNEALGRHHHLDLAMQNLEKRRVLLCDTRFFFQDTPDFVRREEARLRQDERETDYMVRRWGNKYMERVGRTRLRIRNVARRQSGR